ncbi:ribonuclease P protein subunit p30 isoform X3 [Corythoichthys intestinalis]|uniref:ribonuclease P protein subunit p30 isoform X3 n=1 Tax=Corythoichthys intestinalis TaxID=161448 RepID=UPI0025A4E7B7|nr:ribonuclease P protein subunit p30 isoform X3 [Corythoichthys intestinalis]
MSAFMDLNVTFSADKSHMQQLIDMAAHLAVNYTFEATAKKKPAIPSPKPIDELIDRLPIVQGRSRPIRVLNRLTLVMSELSHFRPNPSEYAAFDLLALQPTTEKLFHAACTQLDVDVISVSVTEKLPFFFKRAPVSTAVERGLAFEISYASAIRDAAARRYTVANAVSLTEACKGKVTAATTTMSTASRLTRVPPFRTCWCRARRPRCVGVASPFRRRVFSRSRPTTHLSFVFSRWSCEDLTTWSTCILGPVRRSRRACRQRAPFPDASSDAR